MGESCACWSNGVLHAQGRCRDGPSEQVYAMMLWGGARVRATVMICRSTMSCLPGWQKTGDWKGATPHACKPGKSKKKNLTSIREINSVILQVDPGVADYILMGLVRIWHAVMGTWYVRCERCSYCMVLCWPIKWRLNERLMKTWIHRHATNDDLLSQYHLSLGPITRSDHSH